MSRMIVKRPAHEDFMESPPFPFVGAALGLLVLVNLASTVTSLLFA